MTELLEVEEKTSEKPARAKASKSSQSENTWIAVIYNNLREYKTTTTLLEAPPINRPPTARFLQIPPTGMPNADGYVEARSLFLRPGTNLGISVADWQAIADADRAKSARGEIASFSKMLEAEVFETFPPDFPDEPGSNLTPGFRNFSPKVAVKLIQATTHEDWLDEFMRGETRPEIIKSANEHKAKIIAAKKRQSA